MSGDSLRKFSMLDGRDVLAGGGDDQLLLAVDDREEAVVVEGADVAGVQPAVLVDERAGGLLLEVVAGGVHRAADQDLAVLAELDLHARVGAADGAELEAARAVGGDGAAGLGHAVDVVDLEAEAGHELRDVERHRGGGGAGPGHLVEPEQQLEEPEDRPPRPGGRPPRSPASSRRRPPAPRPTRARRPSRSRPSSRLSGSGSAASLADRPVLIFSHTRGTPKNAVGCTSPSVASSCAGSPIACMWLPLDLRAVEAEHPLGDVGERQVADPDLRLGQPGRLLGADRLEEHVVVGEHHALGVAGRAGRVEDRRRRLGGELGGAGLDLAGWAAR